MEKASDEIEGLSQLLTSSISKYLHLLLSRRVRLFIIGDLNPFSQKLKQAFHTACEKTKHNQGLNLILAVNYGGQKEILKGIKKLFSAYQNPEKKIDQRLFESYIQSMKEADFEQYLESNIFPLQTS